MSATESTEPMTNEEYVSSGGCCCPFCRSQDIEGDSVDIDAGGASQRCWCKDCDRWWVDSYVLTNYEPIE